MNCSRIVPVSPNRTRLVCGFFFRDVSEAVREQNERTIETNCDIGREDFGICERSPANLEAGIFQRGPLSPRHEVGVRYFHDRVRQAMAREGIVEADWVR